METIPGLVVRTEDELGPLSFFVKNAEDSIQRYHAKGQFYEQEDLRAIEKWVDAQGVFWDIGANVGNHTVYFARKFPEMRVIPFEMFPTVIEILKINVELNELRNVDRSYLGKAIGRSHGRCEIESRHPNNLGLVKAVMGSGDVEVLPLDSLHGITPPNFVKIDVEGAEMDVLDGMREIISHNRPNMFIEVDNKNDKLFADWLANNGYVVKDKIKRYEINCNYLIVHPSV